MYITIIYNNVQYIESNKDRIGLFFNLMDKITFFKDIDLYLNNKFYSDCRYYTVIKDNIILFKENYINL
jgi:hypothetical protein